MSMTWPTPGRSADFGDASDADDAATASSLSLSLSRSGRGASVVDSVLDIGGGGAAVTDEEPTLLTLMMDHPGRSRNSLLGRMRGAR
jgi:hypothetical protein